jgi:type IV pilus assembly protein PilY1
MIKRAIGRVLLALGFGFAAGQAMADDIDIYSANTSIVPGAPNVLIVLDNSANWSQSFGSGTKFSAEMVALQQVVGALNTQFNLGLMFYVETGNPNNNTDGGYVRFAIQPMSDSSGNPTNARNCLLKMVGSTSSGTCTPPADTSFYTTFLIGTNPGDKANGGSIGPTMAEAYLYYSGGTPYAGTSKVKADPLAFDPRGTVTNGAVTGSKYLSPIAQGTCQKNFIIVINNGPFQDSSSLTATAMSMLQGAGGDTTIINPPDSTSNNNAGDEWTRFLNKSAVGAVTYTLEVGPATTGQGPYNTALLKSMANQGQGGYYSAISAQTLLDALTRIFNDIQAKNSVFASSSLPLSADNSGAFANQVYMAVFRPDGGGRPRWLGNLKEYQFAADSNGTLTLVDALGQPAAGVSGFATPSAQSFWTSKDTTKAPDAIPPTGTGGFWFFDNKGAGGPYDLPDGEWVEKGGAAQQLRLTYLGYSGVKNVNDTSAPRKVYTCAGGCGSSGVALSAKSFDTSNTAITDALLGTGMVTVSSITSASSINNASIVAGTPVAIASLADLGSKVIQVTTTAAHGFTTGDKVVIQGTGSSTYDSINAATPWTITVTGSTTFTFTVSGGSTPNINPAPAAAGAYKNTTTATVTTASAHGFVAGQKITVGGASPSGFNAVATVISAPDTTHFSYTLPAALGGAASTAGTSTSNTATVVATGHGFTTGQSITIAGATPSGYNGVWPVTVVDANTFTYAYNVAAPLASASGTLTASVGGGRTTLINWVRGLDTQDENGDGRVDDVRASIHGDVLHSRPVVINYGSPTTSNNVYVFYGGNDGVFRAIKGGQAAGDGVEQWAFIPQEFFGKLKRLYDNSPTVLYPSTPAGLGATKRDYFWDGPVTSYVERNSTGGVGKALLFLTVRRGGRFIYAFDVTVATDPKFLWKKGCSDSTDASCDSGFTELGQTWSAPQVARIRANTNPVVIFGAGLDATSEDTEPPAATDTKGRGVYVLDAITGATLWTAGNSAMSPNVTVSGMNWSIASDVLIADRSLDGFADRVYMADVGGNVWRIDLADLMSNWAVWKIASLADRGSVASSRKFLFSPDVVFGSNFDSVVIGSGDREHPLATSGSYNVTNRAYMIKDPNTGILGANLDVFDHCGATVTSTCSNLFDATGSTSVPTDAKGWLYALMPGEKVINGPIVIAGNMIFGTNQPCISGKLNDDGTCASSSGGTLSCTGNLGVARRYDISYLNAAPVLYTNSSGTAVASQLAAGGGFLPSPVAGVVEITTGGQTKNYIFVTDNPLNPGGIIKPTINVPKKRFRNYWREKLE